MGGAIARGMAKGTILPADNITVSNPSQGKLDKLKAEFPSLHITHSNQQAVKEADLVLLAVKPWLIEPVLKEITLSEHAILASVAAGISCEDLAKFINQPERTILRIIPNTAISELQSMTILTGHHLTEEQRHGITEIFNEMGTTLWLPEEKISAATALASCGIAYVFKYLQAAMQAGIEMGIYPQDAIRLAAQSAKGAAEILLNNDTHPSLEIDKVCTPGGLTIKGINELDHAGFSSAIIKAMKASQHA
ncbi:pyrroline-5-carboxylate reductase [gut metagenome]|uniref:Pyrroline-5-carboxylate reductase n=1 Tax=gut metagenome TaxID=749906 RepID=J9F385_9ZZZZ